MPWGTVALIMLALVVVSSLAVAIWWQRSSRTRAEAIAYLREQGLDIVRLPGRLRRLARDPRTPRRARWWLLGLAIYIASPIDPLPDFIPLIGQLDELLVVPLVLRHVRRGIPAEVWHTHFPPRGRGSTATAADSPTHPAI